MKQLILFVVSILVLFPALSTAASRYSPSEGYLDKGHDLSLNKYRQKYFYNNDGNIDPVKLDELIRFLERHKSLLMDSAKMNRKATLILEHGYDNDKAEKEGLEAQSEEAETIAPLIFALEHTRELKANYARMTRLQVHEKVETILLFVAAGYTPYPMTIFTNIKERAKNLLENFFEFKINDVGLTQASNLLLNGNFASQAQLAAARKQGQDLSLLNPPSSPIWTDNEIEKYDPRREIYWGKKFFPPADGPLPTFHFKRMSDGTIKLKTYWLDENELNKKGQPKKKDVTIRVGIESYDASVVNHLARIIGYPANPTTFRSHVKLDLGENTFEQFLSQWKIAHGISMGSAITHVERLPGENAVILKNVTLEAYPEKDEYRKMGPFRMGDNGLRNRREYRAMVLYNSLISLQDEFEYQSRVDAVKDPEKGWLPIFFISDTSSALGFPAMLGNVGTVNEYTWKFTRKDSGMVRLFWLSVFNSRTWKDTTYSDVKWLARRMARIRADQIDAIMDTSGFPDPVKRLYAEKIKSRINGMIVDFDLQKEGFALHPVKSSRKLASMYPEYIDEKGYLKEGAQNYPGNTLPILGDKMTLLQTVVVKSINILQNRFTSLFNPSKYSAGNFTFDLGTKEMEGGFAIGGSRSVSVNPELGPGQYRYLLKDKYSISIPIGMVSDHMETPLALYYTYTYEYVHSVSTMKETGTSRFFALLNPFSILDIRQSLGIGEQLIVTHSIGASIGNAKIKVTDDFQFEAALLGLSISKVKSVYFAKPHPTLFEITTDHMTVAAAQSGFDVRAYLRIAAMIRAQKSKKTYKLYRIDTLNETVEGQAQLQNAFDLALVDNDFTMLDKLVTPHELVETAKDRGYNLGFFVWSFAGNTGVSKLRADGQKLVLGRESHTFDRAANRVWTEKVSVGKAESAVNFLGEYWGEGKHINIAVEGVANGRESRFSDIDVNITASMFDNYCTREEFENDFKNFFTKRSGMSNYIRFRMPHELGVYPELEGTMRWQISKKALRDILKAASNERNMDYLVPRGQRDPYYKAGDPRDDIAKRAIKILRALDKDSSEYSLEQQVKDLLYVFDGLIGNSAQYIAHLRKFVRDEDIWLTTNISNMLELSHPTFRHQKENVFWAPEIGKYQGLSYLDRFRRDNLLNPVFVD